MQAFYGEKQCESKKCSNKAYFLSSKKYLCGVHSRSDKTRISLIKNPNAKELKKQLLQYRQSLVEKQAELNRENGTRGTVICTKLRMMKEPEHNDGYLKVFPNYKHQNRQDGFGCMSLSPKAMGPIIHGQPGLPNALNLENYHQYAKCFPSEVDEDGNPLQSFYDLQKKMYLDPVPHRHKEEAKNMPASTNKNIPLFSIWLDKDSTEHRCTYFESRQFYCNFYERIAKKLKDFKKLKKLLKKGYNLQIVGYDAYPITKTIEECYLDTSRPFLH